MERWVLPLSVVYAFYVPVNLVLYFVRLDAKASVAFVLAYNHRFED